MGQDQEDWRLGVAERPAAVLFDLGGVLVSLAGIPMFRRWLGDHLTDEDIWNLWLDSPAARPEPS